MVNPKSIRHQLLSLRSLPYGCCTKKIYLYGAYPNSFMCILVWCDLCSWRTARNHTGPTDAFSGSWEFNSFTLREERAGSIAETWSYCYHKEMERRKEEREMRQYHYYMEILSMHNFGIYYPSISHFLINNNSKFNNQVPTLLVHLIRNKQHLAREAGSFHSHIYLPIWIKINGLMFLVRLSSTSTCVIPLLLVGWWMERYS